MVCGVHRGGLLNSQIRFHAGSVQQSPPRLSSETFYIGYLESP
ncbi:hypothetical protein L911_1719 [Vibrio fluvialis I21563]|nr:hypothetical protein L911_1719 [Vibrio fluvialis I21563]